LPALNKARQAGLSINCESNLRQLGTSFRLFADDCPIKGRPPSGRDDWGSWVQDVHYFQLVDRYGANRNLWVCPAVSSGWQDQIQDIFGGGLKFWNGTGWDQDETGARNRTATENPWDFTTQSWNQNGITEIIQIGYWYLGCDWRGTNWSSQCTSFGGKGAKDDFWIFSLYHRKTYPYHPNMPTDPNAPLMSDQAWIQPSGKYNMNHGKTWTTDPTTGRQTGDVRVNTLYLDGHVDQKLPQCYDIANPQYGSLWYY